MACQDSLCLSIFLKLPEEKCSVRVSLSRGPADLCDGLCDERQFWLHLVPDLA